MEKHKVTTTSCCSGNHWGPWGPGQCAPGPWGPGPGPNSGPNPCGHNYELSSWAHPSPRPNSGSFGPDYEPWMAGPLRNGRTPRY